MGNLTRTVSRTCSHLQSPTAWSPPCMPGSPPAREVLEGKGTSRGTSRGSPQLGWEAASPFWAGVSQSSSLLCCTQARLLLKKTSQKGVPVPAHHADTKAVLAPLVPVPVPVTVTMFCRGCREGRGRAGASGCAWQQGGWLPSSAPLFMEEPGRLGSVLVFRQNEILIFS